MELAKDFKTVHALSRSKVENWPSNVEHNFIDLTGTAEEMADATKHVEAEYIFFSAWLKQDSEQKNWEVNGESKRKSKALLTTSKQSGYDRLVDLSGQ